MAKAELVSRARVAELKGVSRAAVTAACKDDGPLAQAVRGTKVDLNDPASIVWLSEPQRGPDGAAQAAEAGPGPTKAQMLELSRRKRAAEAEKLELQNAQTPRQSHLARAREDAHLRRPGFLSKRLLGDAAKSIASKVFNSVRAKGTLEEAQRIVRDEISKQLRATKDKQVRLLLRPDEKAPRTARTAARKRARKAAKK